NPVQELLLTRKMLILVPVKWHGKSLERDTRIGSQVVKHVPSQNGAEFAFSNPADRRAGKVGIMERRRDDPFALRRRIAAPTPSFGRWSMA
ncbi:hypothetical protein E4U42_005254, partial [Claviceps africana]